MALQSWLASCTQMPSQKTLQQNGSCVQTVDSHMPQLGSSGGPSMQTPCGQEGAPPTPLLETVVTVAGPGPMPPTAVELVLVTLVLVWPVLVTLVAVVVVAPVLTLEVVEPPTATPELVTPTTPVVTPPWLELEELPPCAVPPEPLPGS